MASSIMAMPHTVNVSDASSNLAVPAKTCTKCGSTGPFSKASYWCKVCKSAFAKAWYKANKDRLGPKKSYPITQRRAQLRRKYGITLEQHDQMVIAQGGRCAICRTNDPGNTSGTWPVDHCHTTGKVRALLCNACNAMLGHSKDSIETHKAAIAYLDHYAQNPTRNTA